MPPSAGQKGQDDRVILVGGDVSPGWTIGTGISGRLGPEYPVKQIIEKITRREPVDGFLFHYLKRVHVEGESLHSPDDLNRWFEQTLNDPQAALIQPKELADVDLINWEPLRYFWRLTDEQVWL